MGRGGQKNLLYNPNLTVDTQEIAAEQQVTADDIEGWTAEDFLLNPEVFRAAIQKDLLDQEKFVSQLYNDIRVREIPERIISQYGELIVELNPDIVIKQLEKFNYSRKQLLTYLNSEKQQLSGDVVTKLLERFE